jgi:hypothetical protein
MLNGITKHIPFHPFSQTHYYGIIMGEAYIQISIRFPNARGTVKYELRRSMPQSSIKNKGSCEFTPQVEFGFVLVV